jgi:hypothetical protein
MDALIFWKKVSGRFNLRYLVEKEFLFKLRAQE